MRGIFFFIAFLIWGCLSLPAQLKPGYEYQQFVDKINTVQGEITFDQGLIVNPSFDLEKYLAAFDKLTLRAPGMKPVYDHERNLIIGNRNVFFLLKEGTTIDSLSAHFNKEETHKKLIYGKIRDNYIKNNQILPKLQAERSAMGYFQLVVWKLKGEPSSMTKYFRNDIVCNADAMEIILKKTEKEYPRLSTKMRETARGIDPTPVIEMKRDRCIVRVIMFNYTGIQAKTFSISAEFPHIIEQTGEEFLLDFGRFMVMF